MIDFHCHIIPEVDDGSKSLDMSIDMLRIAEKDGIHTVCATSHFIPGECEFNKNDYFNKLKKLNEVCALSNIDVNVVSGMEIYINPELPKMYEQKKIWGFNDSRYLLIELPMEQFPEYVEDVFYELKLMGAVPVLAHPERYLCFMEDISRLYKLLSQGIILQVNSGSLTGLYGKSVKKSAEKIIRLDVPMLIGSDAHTSHRRVPQVEEGRKILQKSNKKNYDWFVSREEDIIDDLELEIPVFQKVKRKKGFFSFLRR